jgi:hypothetical protein
MLRYAQHDNLVILSVAKDLGGGFGAQTFFVAPYRHPDASLRSA